MAKFEITSPDGQKFEINAPDDASQDQVMAYAKQQFEGMQKAKVEPDFAQMARSSELGRVAQGAADPIMGAAQLAPRVASYASSLGGLMPNKVSGYLDKKGGQVDQFINQNEQKYNEARQATASQDPWLKITGKPDPNADLDLARVAGNVISPMNRLLAKMLPIKPNMTTGQKIVQGSTAGTVGAAAQPVIDMDPNQSFGATKAVQAGLGFVTGGVLSPILSKIGDKIAQKFASFSGDIRNRAAENADMIIEQELKASGQNIRDIPEAQLNSLRQQVTDSLKQGKNLDPGALIRKSDFEAFGVPGTQGQISRDPTQFAKERNLRGVSGVGEPLMDRFTAQNQKLTSDLMATKGNASEAYPAGVKLAKALKDMDDEFKKPIKSAYAAAKTSEGRYANVDVPTFSKNANKALDEDMLGRYLPEETRNMLNDVSEGKLPLNVNNLVQMDSILSAAQRKAGKGSNEALAIGKVRDALNSADIESGSGEAAKKAFDYARGLAKGRFDLHKAVPALEEAAAAEGTTAADDFVKNFVINGKTEDVKGLAKLLRNDMEAFDEAKAQIGNKLYSSAFGNNTSGDKVFSPERYADALKNIGTEKLNAFFTQAEIDGIKRAGRVGSYINSTPSSATVNTSNSAAAVSNLLQKLPGVPASAAVLNKIGGVIGDSRAAAKALDQTIPQKAAKLTPEEIQVMTRLLSLTGPAVGAGAGSTLR